MLTIKNLSKEKNKRFFPFVHFKGKNMSTGTDAGAGTEKDIKEIIQQTIEKIKIFYKERKEKKEKKKVSKKEVKEFIGKELSSELKSCSEYTRKKLQNRIHEMYLASADNDRQNKFIDGHSKKNEIRYEKIEKSKKFIIRCKKNINRNNKDIKESEKRVEKILEEEKEIDTDFEEIIKKPKKSRKPKNPRKPKKKPQDSTKDPKVVSGNDSNNEPKDSTKKPNESKDSSKEPSKDPSKDPKDD